MAKSPFPKDDINQDFGFDDNQGSGFDDMQASPTEFDGESIGSASQKLLITARLGKSGYEARVLSMPDLPKKTSKVGLEQAARELVQHLKQSWDDFKEVTSNRDQVSGRKVYEFCGEAF